MREAGLIGDGDGRPELRLALANLNQRLRYALGEYRTVPETDTGLIDHDITFRSTGDAVRFCEVISELGMRCRHEDLGQAGRVRVFVTTTDLWLSHGFDAAQKQIEHTAAACGGTYNGFGGPASLGGA
jgi:hypothetical protein